MRNLYQKKSSVKAAVAVILTVLASNAASAQDYTENKINYYISGEEAYVGESPEATGDITILDKITVGGTDYPVTSIDTESFYTDNSKNITSVHIGNAMREIKADAFYNCTKVTDVYISADPGLLTWNEGEHDDFKPDGTTICHVSDVVAWAKFLGNVNLTFRDETSTPFSYTYDEGTHTLTISGTESMPKYHSTAVTPWADYNEQITSVIISDGVPFINDFAFAYCAGLESITLPSSVRAIGDYAFMDCNNLFSMTLGSGVSHIAEHAFHKCPALSIFNMDEANPNFKSSAGCLLTKDGSTIIYIPETATTFNITAEMKSIDIDMLSSRPSITTITVDEGNEYYKTTGKTLLSKDSNILYYYFGNDATLNIPEGVTSIDDKTFDAFNTMTAINLPKSMKLIEGGYVFFNCKALENITISEDNEYMKAVDGILYSKDGTKLIRCPTKKTSVTILSSVRTICSYAFAGCGLTEINIPDGVTEISEKAFKLCKNITKVTIPQSVISIGSEAFFICDKVTDVYCYADPEKLEWTDEDNDDFMDDAATVCHVSAASLNTYKAKWNTGDDDNDVNVTFVGDLETATDVNEVEQQQADNADNTYYNLSGQRVSKPARGLYIRNGKKVVIK